MTVSRSVLIAIGLVGVVAGAGIVEGQDSAQVKQADSSVADTGRGRPRRKKAATLSGVTILGSQGAVQRPLVDHAGATTGGALDTYELQTLPTDGREPSALAFTIPGVAQATGFFDTAPVLSLDGQNSLYTQYYIDGLDNNEGVLGGPRVDLPIDALSLFRVRVNTYGADIGRSSNGVVEASTRSGTDAWHGDAFVEGRPGHSFDAKPPVAIPDVNSLQPNTLAAGFRRFQVGGAAGGPIVVGKTRLSAAGEYSSETQDQPIATPGFAGGVGSAERVKYKGFLRLDQTWSPTQFTTIRAAYSDENFLGRGGGYVVPEADNVQHRIGGSYAITHRSGRGDGGLTNTASVQLATYHWFYPPTGSALSEPTVLLLARDGTPEAQVGSSPFQYDEREIQINLKDVLERQYGAHRGQLGADMIGGTFRLRGDQTSFGGFYTITDTGGIHQSGRYVSIADIPKGYPVQSWSVDGQPQKVSAAQTVIGAFAQDQWRTTPDLVLTYGVRWDFDDITSHGAGSPDLTAIQPRAALNWSVTPRSALRVGAGVYAGKLPYTVYSDALQFGPGGSTPVFFPGAQSGGTITFGNPPSASTVAGAFSSQQPREIRALFARGLKSPRSYQGSIGYQIELASTWGLSIDGAVSYTFNLPRLWDLNADSYELQAGDVQANPTAGKTTTFGDTLRPRLPQPGSFRAHTTTDAGGTSHYFGLYTTVRHQLRDNWAAELTWVWSHVQTSTEDINFAATQGNNFAAEWADGVNDRRHKIDLRTTYTVADRLQLSGVAGYQTGQPINWVSGLNLTGAGPAYGDGFVRNIDRYYGVARNSGRLPTAFTINAGASYLLVISRRVVELRADGFNLLNHVNESGFPSGLAGVDPRTQIGTPGRSSITYLIAGPPRQIQLSARYHF